MDTLLVTISRAMSQGGPLLWPLAFLAGLCTSLNPCAYPMMGAAAGYMWAQSDKSRRRRLLIASGFLLGLAGVYVLLGVMGTLVAPVLGLTQRHWAWIVGGLCILAGAFMAEVLPLNLPAVSLVARHWDRLRGFPGALVLGVLLGLVATPCATPPLVAILSLAASRQMVALGAALMFAYALGHALPAIFLGLLASSLAGLQRLAPYGHGLQIAGGWLIIMAGLLLLGSA